MKSEVKCKDVPVHDIKTSRGVDIQLHSFLTSVLHSRLEAPSVSLSGKPSLPFDEMCVSDTEPTSRLWRKEATITLARNRIPKHPTLQHLTPFQNSCYGKLFYQGLLGLWSLPIAWCIRNTKSEHKSFGNWINLRLHVRRKGDTQGLWPVRSTYSQTLDSS